MNIRRKEAEIGLEQLDEFQDYLYERENAEATIEKYLRDIRTFFRFLGEERILDKQKILKYKEWLLERYAVNSVNSILAALNQFLEFLDLRELKVRRVKVQKNLFLQEERELTREEYQRLVRTAVKEGRTQLALCMETIAFTGIRISELPFFTVESVKRKQVEIFNKGKYRRIFLPTEIRKKLLRFAAEQGIQSGPIFLTRTGNPKSRNSIWREMKSLKEKAGIRGEKIFPHNLRHLFARLYYQVTKDLAGLGDLLGHSSLNITRIYTANTGKIYQKQLNRMRYMGLQIAT